MEEIQPGNGLENRDLSELRNPSENDSQLENIGLDNTLPVGLPHVQNKQIRNNLVDTAIKFLVSPKVVSYDQQSKIKFLEKKGLSLEEIDFALKRAEYFIQNNSVENPTGELVSVASLQPPTLPRHTGSFWSYLRDLTNFLIFISGITCGFHYLYINYIQPYLTGIKRKSSDEALLEIQHSLMAILLQIQSTLERMDISINEHNQILKNLNISEQIFNKTSYPGIEEIQGELKTLKALLINRNAFPPPPVVSNLIPQWQKLKDEESKKEDGKILKNGIAEISHKESASEHESNNLVEDSNS